MRRIFAFLAVAAMTALAIGSAATLIVDGGTIQEGSDLTLTCDDDGVNVAGWGLEQSDGLVYSVRVGDISPDCVGNALFVNVTGEGGTVIASGGIKKPDGGGPGIVGAVESVNITPDVSAELIEDIHIFIEGPAAVPEVIAP